MIHLLTAVGWQQYCSTHLHTNSTQKDTKQAVHRTTQKLRTTRPFSKNAGRAQSSPVTSWHLPYS